MEGKIAGKGCFLQWFQEIKILPMFSRNPIPCFLFLASLWVFPMTAQAQMFIPDEHTSPLDDTFSEGGFAKPYEYERKAYGYDPSGVTYHENQSEDFQVIFITSLPFTAGASFLLTGLASTALTGNFQVGGDYFLPFLGLTFLGSTTVACVSVLTNKYPPPDAFTEEPNRPRRLALEVPLITAKF